MELESRRRPYKQIERARGQQRTRDALLDVADEEFLAGRWEQASLEAMASRARVTKQTLLRNFGSKEGLLEHAAARGYERVRAERFAAPSQDIDGAVANLLDHYERWGTQALRIGAAEPGARAIAELGQQARELHHEWIDHAFGPWLGRFRGKARARRRAALIALCDVHSWWLLTHDLALTRGEVHATLTAAITRLLEKEA